MNDGRGGWRSSSGGSVFLAFANERGIPWELTRTWPGGDRHLETWLKQHYRNGKALCPRCNPGTRRGLFIVGADTWVNGYGVHSVPVMFQRPKVRKPIRFRSTEIRARV
jgi:hypothetical protein